MEREKIKKILNEIGIKVLWTSKEKLLDEVKLFLKDKSYYISPYLELNLKNSVNIKEAELGVFEGIALCEKTGTILVSSDDLSSLIPPISLVILKEENIKSELDDLIDIIKENKERSFSFITGPSRTADIEKQVVIPAHGPKELNLIIYKNNEIFK